MKSRTEFGEFAQRFLLQGSGAEIGTQHGVFAKLISKKWIGKIICVDPWPDETIFEIAQSNLDGPQFHLYRERSLDAVRQFEDGGLDWVYIDADHHYENVKADLEAWFPKVRPGGLVAGHDYVNYEDMGVIQAVDDFVQSRGYRISLTTEDQPWNGVQFPTWWFVK